MATKSSPTQEAKARSQARAGVGADGERGDGRADERGGGGVRPDDQPARRAEQGIHDQRRKGRVEAELRWQARDLCVADAERHDGAAIVKPATRSSGRADRS
jgi:hypothetical protein